MLFQGWSMRALRAEVDLNAIRHNYRLAKAQSPQSKAVAVVKANAYGHGAVRVAQALAAEADAFGVACIEEALELRQAGISQPIWLLEGIFAADELALVEQHQLSMAVHCPEQLSWILAYDFSQPVDMWLKLDSGMHRLGFDPHSYRQAFQALQASGKARVLGKMTHFARADELDHDYTRKQIERFMQVCEGLPGPVSLANSPGTLGWPAAHGDWLRPGLMLYGISPFEVAHPRADQLKPAMRLVSELIAVRELGVGEPVGYGGRFVTDKPMRIGVVALGYGDGYPRQAKDGTPVLVNGCLTRLVGRVSMDMLTVDLTDLNEAKVGDEVVLWGEQLRTNQVAPYCDTIPYELVTKLTRRVPVHYSE